MSDIIDFYNGKIPPSCNHHLPAVWSYPFSKLENCHDYIQWIFPLDEPSLFNINAPILTKEDIKTFQSSPLLQYRLLASVNTYVRFLTFNTHIWITESNHNHLRISRMLKCLNLFSMYWTTGSTMDNLKLAIKSFKITNPPEPDLSKVIAFWEDIVYLRIDLGI